MATTTGPDGNRLRRAFTTTRVLDLGQHRRQDEARRLRDLLTIFAADIIGPDRRMPMEEQIARQFASSRNTARVALQMLADERRVARTVGVGTYATTAPARWQTALMMDPQTVGEGGPRLIGWRVGENIPDPMRDYLAADVDRLAVYEKLNFNGELPASLRTYYVPLRPQDDFGVPDLTRDVFEVLDRFGHEQLEADRTITAVAADESAAELLAVPVGDPLLFIETTVRNGHGDVVLTYHGRQRSDVVQVSLRPERLVDEQ